MSIKPLRPGGRPLNILFLDHTAKLGGGEIALYHLLVHLDLARFNPIVVLGEEGPLADKLRAAGIETCIVPLAGDVANTRKDSLGAGSLLKLRSIVSALGYALRLRSFIKARQIDLVHTNSLKADLIGGVSARLAGVPVVWHVRDRIENDYLPASVVSAFRWACRMIPDYVLANSASTLSTIRLRHRANHAVIHSGYPFMNRIAAVVHEGILTRSPAVKSNPHQTVIGLVGRISRWKGQHIFLAAASEVRKKFPSAKFQIIGSAMFGEEAYEKEIQSLVKYLRLEDCVEFMGFRSDVQQLMDEFDILVHASITGEPFGQVIIEAMGAAKPVVATRGGGVPEIVQEGVTGLLVPMGHAPAMSQAICELLADPERATRMGIAGRERVLNHFTVELTARRIESVFETVVSRKAGQSASEASGEAAVLAP